MEMLDFIKLKENCTGCTACRSVCPVGCIEMKTDEEGFTYPVADDRCIHCGKCERVCPIENRDAKIPDNQPVRAACAVTKSKKIWKKSASGGAFTEICLAFGDESTVVCGAAWDGFRVHHKCIKGVSNIAELCKSKYVASSPENTFKEIADHLKEGTKVIFCGTPCQVAGLRAFLGKDYENLLLIDLICHGVGSPAVFNTALEITAEQIGCGISAYEFRSKQSQHATDHLQKLTLENGKQIYVTEDPYMQLFLDQRCLRPSCGSNCKFRTEHREGDITIADFKGTGLVFPQLLGSKYNYSSIISNNSRGDAVFEKLTEKMKLWECKTDDIKTYNPLFCRQTISNSEARDLFFEEYKSSPTKAVKDATKQVKPFKKDLKYRVWEVLPRQIRAFLIKKSR